MIPASDEAGVPQQGGIFRDQFRSHVGPSGFPRDVERLAKLVTDDLSRPRPRNFANEVDAARHRPAVELSLLWVESRCGAVALGSCPVANQIRTYWWCSPPRTGRQRMLPAPSTARETGASFSKDRCVRTSL